MKDSISAAARPLRPNKPVSPNVSLIPEELKARRQWVVWRYEIRDGKWTKIPYQPHNPKWKAKADDSSTWSTYDAAWSTYLKGGFDGIGYEFSVDDPYYGVDFDNCLVDGEVAAWALPHIDMMRPSYGEISPSRKGIKFIAIGKLPEDKGTRKTGFGPDGDGAIELYDHGRFFAITGNVFGDSYAIFTLPGAAVTLYRVAKPEKPKKIEAVTSKPAETIPGPPVHRNGNGYHPTDDEVLRLIGKSKDSAKFDALWSGQWSSGSQSEADLSLANLLVFYCGSGNEDQARRLFLQSELGKRTKAQRQDYMDSTFAVAQKNRTDYFDWGPRLRSGSTSTNNGQTYQASQPRSGLNRTDLGNAERLVKKFGDKLRWVERYGSWLVWDGRRFAEDTTGAVCRMARQTVRSIGAEAQHAIDADEAKAILRWALASESKARLDAMISLARYFKGIAINPEELDSNPWLLNVTNGTIDLKTATLRPHDPADLITKLAPVDYDPTATCPRWEAFENEIFANDDDLIKYMRRVISYALSGIIRHHELYFLYGSGRNGKSKYIETVTCILGDYARIVNAEILTSKNQESHPTILTELEGRRFVSTIEIEDGKRLAEALVKSLTGGDTISARRMRENFYEFKPTHKLFLAANHKPEIRGTDTAVWSRIKLIPFGVRFTEDKNEVSAPNVLEMDPDLGDKLKAEAPGILRLMVASCLRWQKKGLEEPSKVRDATSRYKAEMDTVSDFIRERCEVAKPHMKDKVKIRASTLFDEYVNWSNAAGVDALTKRKFGEEMERRGFTWEDSNSVRWRIGIKIK